MFDNKISIEQQLEELKRINNYMKLIIDSTHSVFMLLDRNAVVLYCSDSILDLMGIDDINEIIGKPVNKIRGVYDDEAYCQRSRERYKRLLSGEDNFAEDDEINWPNAGKRLYQIAHMLIKSKNGDINGIAIILRDVTVERIQEENQRMVERVLATQMPCLVWDEEGNVINCNKKALCLLGLPEDLSPEKYGEEILTIQPQYQYDGRVTEVIRKQFVSDTLEKGYSSIEVVLAKADGTPLPVNAMGVRVSWRYGNRIFAYLHDLTDVKTKEAEAREAEERVKIMLDSTPLICLLRDENFEVIDCNREALNIFGISNKEDFIKNFHMFYPEFQPDGEKSSEKAKKYIKMLNENGLIEFEWILRTAKGEPLPVKTTLVYISWKGVRRYLTYSRDLREEKANELKMKESIEQTRKLELQKEMAKASSEAKSQFLASMSHEIRTPMNTVIGLLELMRTDNLDDNQKKYIKDIKHMSSVLLQIINDILDFHRIESGKLELLPIHFNLNTFYNDIVSRHKFIAETKNLKFYSSFAPDLPRSVYGDELRIGQIVTNLLSNALKYTRKGYIDFSVDSVTENGKEYIAFIIEDSGIGIKEENFATLFEEFEQFDSHKNRGISGTGLGLPIVKRLAEMMDGNIQFKSKYSEGSVFTFLLPLITGDINKIGHSTEIERVIAKPDTKVLVVDDNAGNITVAVGLLARHGIVPQTASNGLQAIAMIETNRYDLVFMDHMMPEMDGVEATTIIRKLKEEYYHKLPIIALSANAVASAKELFYNSGMNDIVIKPINCEELNRVLLRWLPKERIMDKKSKEDALELPEDRNVSDKLMEELMEINDLSITEGLTRVNGNKKLYIDLLWQFCNGAKNDTEMLNRFVKNGLWKDYIIRVHGLKTVFANIGNLFMSDWAYELENAASRGDILKCIKETSHFCNTMLQFRSKLLNTNLMNDIASCTNKEKISSIDLKKKLEQLLLACDDFQAEAAEQTANELMGVTYNKNVDAKLKNIHDLVRSFDYDEAAKIINGLMKSLRIN